MDVKSYLSDYDSFTEKEIINVSSKGILLCNDRWINFAECVALWGKVNTWAKCPPSMRCVGDRDITDWSFTFYSFPKPVMIKFIPKSKLGELFSKRNTLQRFHDLQLKIIECGYSTFDMS